MNSSTSTAEIKKDLNENKILEYGKWYVEEGLTIIPIGSDGKPLLYSWKSFAKSGTRATTEDVIQWVRQWPDLRWGLATGRGMGIIVIHLKSEETINQWPSTVCSETSDGGIDLFFLHPGIFFRSNVKVRSKKEFMPDIDVIGEDDYVILPLSLSSGELPCEGWISAPDDTYYAGIPDDIRSLILEDPDCILTEVPEGVPLPEVKGRNGSVDKRIARITGTEYEQ
ncbi:MAG: bifunctional DNA primase/polymerase [Minisyncoccia bacterium]|jgi:hypothetical protein